MAEALCAQLRGVGDDTTQRHASLWGHHFPISTQALGHSSPAIRLPHTLTPTGATAAPPHPPPSGSFSRSLFLHLLPGDTLIVPMAINTSLSMWQPCVPQSPSQRSHWLRDCEKLQQAQDPHIHMEICEYKYRAGAERKAAQTQLALLPEQDLSDTTAMAPIVYGQTSYSKEHLTPAHKVNILYNQIIFYETQTFEI